MPDNRTHRGPHPEDEKLFSQENLAIMRLAAVDLCLLLTKGYSQKSALKLVGDHFSLLERQRIALLRCCCSDQQLENRLKKNIPISKLENLAIAVDGYNCLITLEAALSSSFIFAARDGTYKDLASIHSTYRKVTETMPAVTIMGKFLKKMKISRQLFLLDSPISNSGRLKSLIAEICEQNGWQWDIQLTNSPDKAIIESGYIAATSDSIILDKAKSWTNLTCHLIKSDIPNARIIDLFQ